MNNVNNQSAHPEPFDSPFVLRFSKDEWRLKTGFVEGCRSWFDKLTTNGRCHMYLFNLFVRSSLRKAARELNDAAKILKDYPKIASEHAVKAKAYENTIEKAYHIALADLFKGSDTVYMLKMREIYRHFCNAADRGDEAANIISSIVMKHT